MGQEVSATSSNSPRAVAVIANGGMLVKTKLIFTRGRSIGADRKRRFDSTPRPLSPCQLMEGVVLSPHGTGHLFVAA